MDKLDNIQKKLDELQEMIDDWKKNSPEKVEYVPVFIGHDSFDSFDSDPCRFCNNNPRNNPFASGICNCVLPYLKGRGVIY